MLVEPNDKVNKSRKISRGKSVLLFTTGKFNSNFPKCFSLQQTFTQNQIERLKKLRKGKFSCSKDPCRSSMLFCAYYDSGGADLSLQLRFGTCYFTATFYTRKHYRAKIWPKSGQTRAEIKKFNGCRFLIAVDMDSL